MLIYADIICNRDKLKYMVVGDDEDLFVELGHLFLSPSTWLGPEAWPLNNRSGSD